MERCYHCGSKSIKKSSAIYEQGVSTSSGRSNGTSFGARGGLRAYSGKKTSTRVSGSARKNAPPEPILAAALLIVGVVVGTLLGLLCDSFQAMLVLGIGGGFAGMIAGFIIQSDSLKKDKEYWNRQWYCSRCGQFSNEPQEKLIAADHHSVSISVDATPPSLAGPTDAYAQRLIKPIQRAKHMTDRDLAGLQAIATRSVTDGSFNPLSPYPLDLGIVSRLSSLGCLEWRESDMVCAITETGLAQLQN